MSSVAPPIVGETVAYNTNAQVYTTQQQEYVEAPRRDYLVEQEQEHEKREPSPVRPPPAAAADDDEEEDEDMDQLIAELESADGAAEEEEEGSQADGMSAKPVPEELLQTDTRTGLSDSEVLNREWSRRDVHRSNWLTASRTKEVWYEPDVGGEGELDSQVSPLLHRSYSIRHGGCRRPRRRSS